MASLAHLILANWVKFHELQIQQIAQQIAEPH
jgi:hypothetical protein